MIDQIISALKISLAECNKYEEPARYIFELSEVLKRYKTNLFLAAEKEYQLIQDPKELFNARINLSWHTRPTYGTNYEITDRSPVLLQINGLVPAINERINRERTYNKAVDISDIVDLEKVAAIKTDWYEREVGGKEISPEKIFEEHPDVDTYQTSVYFEADRTSDGRIYFATQISSVVDPVVERNHAERISALMSGDPKVSPRMLAKRACPVEITELPPANQPAPKKEYTGGLTEAIMKLQGDGSRPNQPAHPTRFRSKNHMSNFSAAKMNRRT